MRQALLLLIVCVAASWFATAAYPAVFTFQEIYSTPWDGSTVPVAVPLFDPSWGTLRSVTIDMDQRGSLTYGLDNDNLPGSPGSIDLAVYHVIMSNPYWQTVNGMIGPDDGDGPGAQAGGADYLTGTCSFDWLNQSHTYITDPYFLLGFTGIGSRTGNSYAVLETFQTLNSGVQWMVLDRTYEQRLTLTYDYLSTAESVPEPGTLALLACGLGVGWLRRLRRR